jgi:hypothetical protein
VPSQAEIQCECAFTYMDAVLRKNLTDTLAADANDVDTASDTGGALNDGRDRARFCRTDATCSWGVSDPRFSGRRTSTGGWQRGSLTPRMPLSLPLTAALTATQAAQSAARCTGGKSHTAKNIADSICLATALTPPRVRQGHCVPERGTLLRRLCSPLLDTDSCLGGRKPGERDDVCASGSDCCYGGPCEPRRGNILRASRRRPSTGARLARCPPGALRAPWRRCSRRHRRAGPEFGFAPRSAHRRRRRRGLRRSRGHS